MNIYVPGQGNQYAKMMFIGEAPSYDEERTKKCFTGPSGNVLNECLKNAGITRGELWITNVFKYMIAAQPKDSKPIPAQVRAKMAGIDVQQSINELRIEIDQIKPNVICLLGGTALWALFGKDKITPYRGSILSLWNYKCVPTYHPASVLHTEEGKASYWQKVIIELDLKRVKEQSNFPEINRPSRNLIVCRNSAQLEEFYLRAKQFAKEKKRKIKLSVDIEALRCIPVCVSLAFDHITGICVPLWNKTPMTKISDIPMSDLVSIWLLIDKILNDPDFLLIGQNFKYDQDKLKRLGFSFPKLYSDTMLKAFAINPELSVSLAFNTSVYTEEPYYKDEGLEFDYTKQSIDDLFLYGAKDAPVTLEIDDKMDPDLDEIGQRPFYENFLMELHNLYSGIENQGLRVIEENRTKLLKKYIKWGEEVQYQIFKDTGEELNVNSKTRVPIVLYEIFGLPKRKGTGEEVLTQLLSNVVKKDHHRRAINNILLKRRIEKTIGTYLLALNDFDGRMRTNYFLCLDTGRTSTKLMEPPVRPGYEVTELNWFGKKSKKKKYIGAGFQVLTKHGDVGGDVREMYGPDLVIYNGVREEEILLNADSNQAEARVIARLCNDDKMLAMYDSNDIHALTASWFLGGTEEKYSKKVLGYECPERFLGKTLRHAGHLGAKKTRAALEINTSARKYNIQLPMVISEKFCDLALKIFHKMSPAVQGIFQKEVIDVVSRTRVLIAPLPYGLSDKGVRFGGRRTFYERYGDELFRQAFSYIPQRAISDNTKCAALRNRKRIPQLKYPSVESHDALTYSMPYRNASDWGGQIQEEMQRPIDFTNCSLPRQPLVIPCSLEIGHDYANLEKFKP